MAPAFPSVIFTEGVRFLCDEARCNWFLSILGSYLECEPELRTKGLLHCELRFDREGERRLASCTLIARGGRAPGRRLFEHHVKYTDLDPELDGVQLWAGWDGARWHVYLPSEH